MTQEEKDGVIWWAIDDALKAASSFYESMARSHITDLVNAIKASLDRNGLQIVEKAGVPPAQPQESK
jgi:hypothetical protein